MGKEIIIEFVKPLEIQRIFLEMFKVKEQIGTILNVQKNKIIPAIQFLKCS